MNADRWRRIGAIFDQVVEAPPSEREALLVRMCSGDAQLQIEVAALLRSDDGRESFEHRVNAAQSALAAEWSDTQTSIEAGKQIGPWRVVRELGRGGMGVVLLVERADRQFEQRAALKLIKLGMDSEAVLGRFLRERQILAHLDHPNIARLLDGGITDEGRPYFAMDYVDGSPLLRHCAERRLGLAARIKLFVEICAAVQFAHRALVVHLDLKSSNVLVTSAGTVKLLDFGIAKLMGNDSDATQTGDVRGRPLTLAYAAPEQLSGGMISTATDIYSLGAILYELLTDLRPHDLSGATSTDEIRRIVETTSPRLASERAAANSPIAARYLRGDLDTIVAKSLKHEPERRYATADAFAADLNHYLAGEPIGAHRDSRWYRARKFALRHRLGLALGSIAILGLTATAALALWEAARARAQAQRAETVTDFVIDIFRVADPKGAPGGLNMSVTDVLDAGARRLDVQLTSQPQLAAQFAEVIGEIYVELGQYDRAIALVQGALEKNSDAPNDSRRADLMAQLARAQYEKGDYANAEINADIALRQHRAAEGESSVSVALDLGLRGAIARRRGDFKQAEPLLRQALAISRANLRAPDAKIAANLNELAVLCSDMHRLDEGSALTEEALAMFRSLYGENHLDVAENLTNLGSFRMQSDKAADALPPLEEAIAIYRRLLPADHPLIANALVNYARAFDRLGRYGDAEPLYAEALSMQRRLLGDQHPDVATTLNNLAILHMHTNDFRGSAGYSEQALAIWVAQGKPDHPFALGSKANLSVALRESGDLVASERLIREVLAARRLQLGEKHFLVSFTMDQLGIVLRLAGRPGEALVEHKLAQAARATAGAMPAQELAAAHVHYSLSELDLNDFSSANAQIDEALSQLNAMHPVNNERLGDALVAKARIALAQRDVVSGCTASEQALALRPPEDLLTGWRHAEALAAHGQCLVARGDILAGREEVQSALAALQRSRGVDHWMTVQVRATLRALPKG